MDGALKTIIILTLAAPWAGLAGASEYKTGDLFDAVKGDDPGKVQEIVGSGVGVDIADKKGRTALFFAARRNKPLAAKALLELGADPLRQSRQGTPLEAARRNSRTVYVLIQDHIDAKVERDDPNRATLARLRATGTFQGYLEGDTEKLFCALLEFKSGPYTIQELERYFGSVLVGETYGNSLIQPLHYEFEQKHQIGGRTTLTGRWVFGYPRKASTPYVRYKIHPDEYHEVADFRYVGGDTVIMQIPEEYRGYPMCEHPSIEYQMDHSNYVEALKRALGSKPKNSNE